MSALVTALPRLIAGSLLVGLLSGSAVAQQTAPSRVRGTIESVSGDALAVKSRSGEQVTLHTTGDLQVAGIVKTTLSEIKVGSFIGATTVPGPDGAHNAVEVHVFPEAMRGAGEGSRSWDSRPNSTMTNATVAQTVAGNDGSTLTVKYNGGEKIVTVTPATAVVAFVPGDRADLKPGAQIVAFVKSRPDGSFDAARISVGRDGVTPPM
ncbi:MAG TPA: hypothetical protein VGC77_19075 [Rhodopseudomonas sp.]|uniref:hypothetical protein n=1 Tax=Rhodopseudomonas sp. TaxID=1078 RepID=UPI002EDA8942